MTDARVEFVAGGNADVVAGMETVVVDEVAGGEVGSEAIVVVPFAAPESQAAKANASTTRYLTMAGTY